MKREACINICMHFAGLVPTADASTSPCPGSLWASQKVVKILLFNATDSKYAYIHRKEWRHLQKVCINGQKKQKWGEGRAGGRMVNLGILYIEKQWLYV